MNIRYGRQALDVFNSHGRSDWFRFSNKADTPAAEVWLYDDIGYYGTPASAFVEQLAELDSKTLTVHLNSRGGDVFDGIAIYNALRTHPAEVTVMVDAMAASIASVIAQAGSDRVMVSGSQMMIHNAWGLAVGDAASMREYAGVLDLQSENIAEIYAERSGLDADVFRGLMDAETWMRAETAVSHGLADRVFTPTTNDQEATEEADAAAASRKARIAAMLRQAEEITL